MKSLNRQSGMSLIEILVTVVVLGVGLLGAAALQMTSINSNQSGHIRSQASAIAEDLQSRIKAAKFTTYSISTPTTLDVVLESYRGSPYTCNAGVTMCRNSSTGSASECTVADLTVYDRWEVCQLARDELPEGEVYVSHNGIRATIAVAWTPIAARDDGGQMSILNPQCASMGIANTKDCILLEIIP